MEKKLNKNEMIEEIEVNEEVKAEEVVEAPKKRTRKAAAKTEEETKTEE